MSSRPGELQIVLFDSTANQLEKRDFSIRARAEHAASSSDGNALPVSMRE